MFSDIDVLIEDLEETRDKILNFIKSFLQHQAAGETHKCQMLEASIIEAHEYLVRTFGIKSEEEIEQLLSQLKNDGKPHAYLTSGI